MIYFKKIPKPLLFGVVVVCSSQIVVGDIAIEPDAVELRKRISSGAVNRSVVEGRIEAVKGSSITIRVADGKLWSYSDIPGRLTVKLLNWDGFTNASQLLREARKQASLGAAAVREGRYEDAKGHGLSAKSAAERIKESSPLYDSSKILVTQSIAFLKSVPLLEGLVEAPVVFEEVYSSFLDEGHISSIELKRLQDVQEIATAALTQLGEIDSDVSMLEQLAERAVMLGSHAEELSRIKAQPDSAAMARIDVIKKEIRRFVTKYPPADKKSEYGVFEYLDQLRDELEGAYIANTNEEVFGKVMRGIESADQFALKGEFRTAYGRLAAASEYLDEISKNADKYTGEQIERYREEIGKKDYHPDRLIQKIESELRSAFLPSLIDQLLTLQTHFSDQPGYRAVFENASVAFDSHVEVLLEDDLSSEAIKFSSEIAESFPAMSKGRISGFLLGMYFKGKSESFQEQGEEERADEAYHSAISFLSETQAKKAEAEELIVQMEENVTFIAKSKNEKLIKLIAFVFLFLLGGGVGFWIGEIATNASDRYRRYTFERVGLIFAKLFQFFSSFTDRLLSSLNAKFYYATGVGRLFFGALWLVAVFVVFIPVMIICFVLLSTMLWLTVPVCIFAVIAYLPLRTAHFIWLRASRQRYVCPSLECRQEGGESMPLYECKCGIRYDRLYPNFYGIFNHVCLNKSKHRRNENFRLPTLEVFRKRLNLKRYCPDPRCGAELVSGRSRHSPILVFGGESSGKTVFVYQAISMIMSTVNQLRGGSAELVGEHSSDVQKVIDNLSKGIRPAKTAGTLFHAIGIRIRLPNQRQERLVQFYDVDGMRFLKIEDILRMQAIEKIEGIVFLVDPFSLPELSWEAEHVQHDDAPSESPLNKLVENLDQGTRHLLLDGRVGKKAKLPLSVVLSKIDATKKSQHSYLEQVHRSQGGINSVPATEIFDHLGATALFARLEQTFSKVNYFTCSGLGRSATGGKGSSFTATGILEPIVSMALPELAGVKTSASK